MSLEPLPDDIARETAAYRQALGAFATGVCVVTADGPSGPLGITVNSFTSVSLEPRLVLWCLDERSDRWPVFADADSFAVHVLPSGDKGLARRFAKGVSILDDHEFERDGDGPPRLPEALARFECRTHARLPMGDHVIIVGRVERFMSASGEALTFFRGRFGAAADPATEENRK